MPHILMIATGGTIACCETAHGLSPALDSAALLGALPELSALCTVETLDLMQLDSTDVTAADRQRMAQAVWQNREKFDGFVLTHGTDTLEETAYFFESATLHLRSLCETQMPGIGGYGRREGLEFQLPSGHIEIAGAGWVHMQIDTLLPHCRYMPATWLTDTVRQLLTAYMQRTNFRLHFKQMLLVIDEHSDVDGRQVFDQDNKGWKAVSNALKGLVIDDDDQYHLSVHMMSSRSAENVCHISLVLPESEEEFFRFHRKGIAYRPLEPSVALCPSTSFCLV